MNQRSSHSKQQHQDPNSRPQNHQRPDNKHQETLGVRDLRSNVAASLRRANDGERIVITVDGKPVAQLGPLMPSNTGVTLWDLAGAGLIEPPRRHDQPATPPPMPVPADVRADRLLEAVRGRR